MSIFHHKAWLVKQQEQEVFYSYCPDTIEQKSSFGEFKINLSNWEPIIISEAKPVGEIVVYVEETCVRRLTQKIQKSFQENKELPKEVLWIS
jgi:hypothetical protein